MEEITLQQLLEAGCHFGHKSERWNPRASEFIYTEKDGIHIIDLVKTKAALEEAAEFIKNLVAEGGEILFVGTKRQAKGIIREEIGKVGAPFFSERWIGGFLTNWDEIRKNVRKVNRMEKEQAEGDWAKYPKHEQVRLARHLKRLNMYYAGVTQVTEVPQALFVVDVRKESAAVREARRVGIPVVGVVDTNSDPQPISHVIPANDDAVGSVQLIVKVLAAAYATGKKLRTEAVRKQAEAAAAQEAKSEAAGKPAAQPAKPAAKAGVKPAAGSADKPVKKAPAAKPAAGKQPAAKPAVPVTKKPGSTSAKSKKEAAV